MVLGVRKTLYNESSRAHAAQHQNISGHLMGSLRLGVMGSALLAMGLTASYFLLTDTRRSMSSLLKLYNDSLVSVSKTSYTDVSALGMITGALGGASIWSFFESGCRLGRAVDGVRMLSYRKSVGNPVKLEEYCEYLASRIEKLGAEQAPPSKKGLVGELQMWIGTLLSPNSWLNGIERAALFVSEVWSSPHAWVSPQIKEDFLSKGERYQTAVEDLKKARSEVSGLKAQLMESQPHISLDTVEDLQARLLLRITEYQEALESYLALPDSSRRFDNMIAARVRLGELRREAFKGTRDVDRNDSLTLSIFEPDKKGEGWFSDARDSWRDR